MFYTVIKLCLRFNSSSNLNYQNGLYAETLAWDVQLLPSTDCPY
jgi:hypothetical protein